MSSYKEEILKKIDSGTVIVGIMGLGYVGLPLAVTFAGKDIAVIGFELSDEKVAAINEGRNYVCDVKDSELKEAVKKGTLIATKDFPRIAECDAIIICVPTPLNKFKQPDMSYIESACMEIGNHMSPGTFISLESTTYPTTTEKFMLPILENKKSGYTHGREFWLAYSPERVDPGNSQYNTENITKVLGAMTKDGQEIGMALYGKAIQSIHPVSNPRAAEMTKILENTYRLVNISLINELALLCGKMKINIWEVIEAAKTKPFGFNGFYPGPGIGGHCIPIDPYFLEFIAKEYDFNLTMIHAAGQFDTLMAHRMTIKITSALNKNNKSLNGSKVFFIGVAYKADIDDVRESPAIRIINEVVNKGGEVCYHDPYIPEITTVLGQKVVSNPLDAGILEQQDCVVIATDHSCIDWKLVQNHSGLIVDLRNAIKTPDSRTYKL